MEKHLIRGKILRNVQSRLIYVDRPSLNEPVPGQQQSFVGDGGDGSSHQLIISETQQPSTVDKASSLEILPRPTDPGSDSAPKPMFDTAPILPIGKPPPYPVLNESNLNSDKIKRKSRGKGRK